MIAGQGRDGRVELFAFNPTLFSSMLEINKLWKQANAVEKRTICNWQKQPTIETGNAILIRLKHEWELR